MVNYTAINVREPIHTAALMSKLIVRYALCIMNYALTIVHYALKICSSVLLSFPTLSRIPIPHSSFLIGSSADGFATAGCLSGNTRFGISPSHFVGSSLLISNYASCIGSVFLCLPLMCRFSHFHDFLRARALWSRLVNW